MTAISAGWALFDLGVHPLLTPSVPPSSAPPSPAPPSPPTGETSFARPGRQVFTGDWLIDDGCTCHTYTAGYTGELVRHCNGWSIFRTTRAVAAAIVAEQQNLVTGLMAEHTGRGAHLADAWLHALRQSAFITWLGPLIVIDSRRYTGDDDQVEITAPDADNLYTIGWGWCWMTVDSADVHTIHGTTYP